MTVLGLSCGRHEGSGVGNPDWSERKRVPEVQMVPATDPVPEGSPTNPKERHGVRQQGRFSEHDVGYVWWSVSAGDWGGSGGPGKIWSSREASSGKFSP